MSILSDHSALPEAAASRPGTPPPEPSAPLLCCGHCLAVIADAPVDPRLRCPACHKRNALPRGVRASCERCGREQRIRLRQLASEPRCTRCGEVLSVDDVVLTPLHRRRRRRQAAALGYRGRYWAGGRGQWVFTLVILAMAALLALKLIARL